MFAQTMPTDADPKVWAQALKIHKKAIIVDGHNDITSPMVDEDLDLATNTVGKFHRDGDPFHTDLNRCVEQWTSSTRPIARLKSIRGN